MSGGRYVCKLMRILCLAFLIGALSQNAWAQPSATAADAYATQVATATRRLLENDLLKSANVGLAVLDVNTGQVIESYRGSQSVVPASILKLSTTATALAVLGSEYRFQTELCYTGGIVDGELRGDLVIVGGGDPSLGTDRPEGSLGLDSLLLRWTTALKAAGITRVTGHVIGDESVLPGALPHASWQWDDIGNYYGAGAGGLMIHENYYSLRLQQSSTLGNRPIARGTEPPGIPIEWKVEVTSAGSRTGDQSYIFGAPGSYDRVIRGTIPVGKGIFRVKGALPDPALAAATWLREALTAAGIEVAGEARTAQAPVATVGALDTYYSPTLGALAQITNFRSVNLFAEAIYKALAQRWGTVGDDDATGEKLVDYWRDRGIASGGWAQVDGSGLATNNLITPLQLAQVLRKSVGYGLRETIPRVGEEGTVRGLLRGDDRAGRLRAKSGTLSRVRALAGFATRPDGTELAFVVVANNFTEKGSDIRRALGEWMGALVE